MPVKAFVCALLAAAAASIALVAQAPPLRLVSTPWAPFTNPAPQPRFALDLVEAALGRVGIRATTTIVEPARFTTVLLSNEFEGSAAAWRDPERERVLIYSRAYLENRLVLVGRRSEDVSATTLTALKGKRIAIVEGYAYGDAINESGASLVRVGSEEATLRLVLDNNADYALMDDLVVQYIVNTYPKEAKERLSLGTTPLVTRTLHFVMNRARPDAQSIIDRFNGQLRGMVADGTYHRLLHVQWIQADVDGDGVTELIASNDRVGAVEPERTYLLFTTESPKPKPVDPKQRFFVGGNIYLDWASVPTRYKFVDTQQESDSDRSTASIFHFVW